MTRVDHGAPEKLKAAACRMLPVHRNPAAPDAQLRPYTREILSALPPPPKEGEKWPEFDAAKAFKLEKTFAPDPEGFLQYWLLAGPIPMETAMPKFEGVPKEGDKYAGDRAWKAHQSADYFVDLTALAAESGRDAA